MPKNLGTLWDQDVFIPFEVIAEFYSYYVSDFGFLGIDGPV